MKRSQRKKKQREGTIEGMRICLYHSHSLERSIKFWWDSKHRIIWVDAVNSIPNINSNYPVFIYSSIRWSSTQLWACCNDTWLHACNCRKLNDTPNSLWCRNPAEKWNVICTLKSQMKMIHPHQNYQKKLRCWRITLSGIILQQRDPRRVELEVHYYQPHSCQSIVWR